MAPSVRAFPQKPESAHTVAAPVQAGGAQQHEEGDAGAAVLRQPRSAGLLRGREGGSRRELGKLAVKSPECHYSARTASSIAFVASW